MRLRGTSKWLWSALTLGVASVTPAFASEADLIVPNLDVKFFNGSVSGITMMLIGIGVCALGLVFGLVQFVRTKNLPVHSSMGNVSGIIWETCKSYLAQQPVDQAPPEAR